MTNPDYFWSDVLKEVLRSAYGRGGLAEAVKTIPQKPRGAIAVQAHRLHLTTPRPRKLK